jgi:hypothetical protein
MKILGLASLFVTGLVIMSACSSSSKMQNRKISSDSHKPDSEWENDPSGSHKTLLLEGDPARELISFILSNMDRSVKYDSVGPLFSGRSETRIYTLRFGPGIVCTRKIVKNIDKNEVTVFENTCRSE